MDVGWVHDRAVGEPEDVYELVSEYGRVHCRQRGCCRPWRRWRDCGGRMTVSKWRLWACNALLLTLGQTNVSVDLHQREAVR